MFFGRTFEHFVHAAASEAGQVKGDILISQLFETGDKAIAKAVLKEMGHFIDRDFDPGDIFVVAHPELAEAIFAQKLLGGLNLLQLFPCNGVAIGEAGRKAGK